jgi:hypothetical protein
MSRVEETVLAAEKEIISFSLLLQIFYGELFFE